MNQNKFIDKKHHHKKVNYGDWVKEQDPTTKMEFYKNTKTGQKQFKEPDKVAVVYDRVFSSTDEKRLKLKD